MAAALRPVEGPHGDPVSLGLRQAQPGETVKLAATATDPDGNKLTYKWWEYADADSAAATVSIANSASPEEASFAVPDEPCCRIEPLLIGVRQ